MPIKVRKYVGLRILLEEEKAQQAESWTLGNSPEAHYLPAPHPMHPGCSAGGTTKLPLPPGAPPKHPGICEQQNRRKMSDEDTEVPGEVMGKGGGQGWESKRQMWDVCKAHTWGWLEMNAGASLHRARTFPSIMPKQDPAPFFLQGFSLQGQPPSRTLA